MTGFYLTGSINVPTVEDAFRLVGARLQPGVTRVPDGEPGNRANWVLTQADQFLREPDARRRRQPGHGRVRAPRSDFGGGRLPHHRRRVVCEFSTHANDGVLAQDSRFLVSIPTPFNAVNSFVEFDSQVEVAYAYEQQLRRSVDALQEVIPPSDLAIQWDLPTELATIEGWFPNPYGGVEPIFAATARLAHWVHDDAELTFHLCYGDSKFGASPFMGDPPNEEAAARGGRHILPRDATAIVALANGLSRHVQRRIDAIQAATVAAWTKRAHWQPLADLALEADTEVFLGLLHAEDGAVGARARAAVAAEFLPEFGISTECGLGRHSAEQLEAVLVAWQEFTTAREPALATG